MANSDTKFKIYIIDAHKQDTRRKIKTAVLRGFAIQPEQQLLMHQTDTVHIWKNDAIPHTPYSLQCYYTLKTLGKIQRGEISHAVFTGNSLQAVQEQFSDVINHLDNTQMLAHQILPLIHFF